MSIVDDDKKIHSLKTIPMYAAAMRKLTVSPNELSNEEKTFLLTTALICLRKYKEDRRLKSYNELAYSIILKYAIVFSDYAPLYDYCVNMGYYPIAQAITSEKKIDFGNISDALLHMRIEEEYRKGDLIETLDQKQSREKLLSCQTPDFCYIAPTSFGKSSVIFENIRTRWATPQKVAIIVPTKSLLMQTYRSLRSQNFHTKILIHDEMYSGEESFIAVLTQERALRLLDQNSWGFDSLYIDEAHRLLERDSRSILLSRLIKLNRQRCPVAKNIYLSPLLADAGNLALIEGQHIFEQRIHSNMKEPELFEYTSDGKCYRYNRFVDDAYETGTAVSLFSYITSYATEKNFCYLYTPRKIEQFSFSFAKHLGDITSEAIKEIQDNLANCVHKDFVAIDYLSKGLVYLHGKMPDSVKEYLEFKFASIPELRYLVANKVILEGINLPIDSLFILSGNNLPEKDLINLIGRVNRLDYIFTTPARLSKLMTPVHFVNSDEYNRKDGKLRNKMRLLCKTAYTDKVRNPVLKNFAVDAAQEDASKCQEILAAEQAFFENAKTDIEKLKQRLIALGMTTIYEVSDSLCQLLLDEFAKLRMEMHTRNLHFLERLQKAFVLSVLPYIKDHEFARLANHRAINYYKKYYQDRKRPLKDRILIELAYFHRRIESKDAKMYIGESYGELPFAATGRESHRLVYVDLSTKSASELVNIAIVKQKIEDDFTSFKLQMFFNLMLEYDILSATEYNEIVYGTNDSKKIDLLKMGLTISMISRLEEEKQLQNISLDANGNMHTTAAFEAYKREVDDFFRFSLDRVIN